MEQILDIFNRQFDALVNKLPDLAVALLVMVLFTLVAIGIHRLINGRLKQRTEDKLRAMFIARVVKWAILLVGLMLAMKAAGLGDVAAGLLAGAGVSAFIVGLALKDIGENFLAGFLLSFSRPFRINDTIEVEGVKGKVLALNLRNTRIKTLDGKDIFIPNASLIKNNLQNYTLDGFMRFELEIGVDYDSDFSKTRKMIQQVLDDHPYVASDHAESKVVFGSLGSSTYNILVQYWVDMFNSGMHHTTIRTEVLDGILDQLNNAGVNMPGEVIELKNNSVLPQNAN